MTPEVLYILYAVLAVGAAGVVFLLPSARPAPRTVRHAGGVLALAALAVMGVQWTRWIDPAFLGRSFFVIFGGIAVIAAVLLITSRRPVYSALYFILVMLGVTGLCFLAAAEFLGAALVIVYGGAILVTYVFVIMLAQQAGPATYDNQAREPLAAVLLGFLLVAAATQAMAGPDPLFPVPPMADAGGDVAAGAPADAELMDSGIVDPWTLAGEEGNTRAVGRKLMSTYVVAIEVAGLLLLLAMVGALAIARKRIDPEDLTPEERAERRREQEDVRRRGREAAPF